MRSVVVSLGLLVAWAGLAVGKPAPLTVKDLSLMLRTGYSAAAIEQEVAARHLLEPIDEAAEKALLQAGAPVALVAKLKSGAYAVPADQVAGVQQELEARAQRQAQLNADAARQNAQYQQHLAQGRANAAQTMPMTHAIATATKGDLVTSKNGILSTFNDQVLEKKKLIALYFSAYWCGYCRKFTPKLVEYYNRTAAGHPEFEVVFVSQDRTGSAMEKYMRDSQMPWPAVAYDKIKEKAALQKYAGSGIPCLVVIDSAGRVVSDGTTGDNDQVFTKLDQILAGGPSPAVAQGR